MRAVPFIAAAALLLGAACGGGNGESTTTGTTVSVEEYVRAADELCSQVGRDVSELGAEAKIQEIQAGSGSESEKMEQMAAVFEEQLLLITSFREDFERLGAPATGAEDVEQFLEHSRSAEDALQRAVDELREGDENEAVDALQDYAAMATQSAAVARDSELDFAACGAGA